MKLALKLLSVLLSVVVAQGAQAGDERVRGKRVSMKDSSGSQRLTLISVDVGVVSPTSGSGNDPTITGASLLVTNPITDETASMILPASFWSVNDKGNVYKFRNREAPLGGSPVSSARIKGGKLIKIRARATGVTLDEPSQRVLAFSFASGTTQYCMEFGGRIRRDQAGRFVAKNAPVPAQCPGGSAPTTTTTTTLPPPGLCGDASINDTNEQCDPPGSSCGGGALCDADCTCPCDFLDPSICMYPFPSDYLTIEDPSTVTGRRIHFSLTGMPRNVENKPIQPSDYNHSDGFSPGAMAIVKVPNVDLAMTGAAPSTDIERSLDANAPIVIVNADTLEHHLFWAELDVNAASDDDRPVILRPGVNLEENTRYIVAMRNMRDASGTLLTPSADFLAYRDNTPTGDPVKEARRADMEGIFTTLAAANVPRGDLYLAWDFTVASVESTTKRLLFMRDDAFATLGAAAPSFVVTQVEDDFDPFIYRVVRGTYLVDRYVDSPTPSARMIIGANELPIKQPTPQQAAFTCNIPRAALADALSPAVPARASIYGHGLFGEGAEITTSTGSNVQRMGDEHNFVFCATDWIGMSLQDIPNALASTQDLSNFPTLPDRLQQSVINFLFLARLMIHDDGFAADPAFQDVLGNPVLDTSNVFYDGNSQGGIAGGMLMSVAQDITRGVLGVPAINYSTLLRRSVDFDEFALALYPAYPDELERSLLFALIQMLWDRGEPNGYAHHMTDDPLPNTPPHEVLLHVAFGDHQVANVATEVQARTIGASIYQPALVAGRHSDVDPYFDIPAIPSFPFNGSALVIWDDGQAPTPPSGNVPPRAGDDPHSAPRRDVEARLQKSEFLKVGGAVVDVCSGAPCVAD